MLVGIQPGKRQRKISLYRPNCILILFYKLYDVVTADTGAEPLRKKRKLNKEQLKAKKESEKQWRNPELHTPSGFQQIETITGL